MSVFHPGLADVAPRAAKPIAAPTITCSAM